MSVETAGDAEVPPADVVMIEFPLAGPAGEPVDLWRTFRSHGFAQLPPMAVDFASRSMEVTLPLPPGRPRTVRLALGPPRRGVARAAGDPPGPRVRERLRGAVRHILRLDEDLSAFYGLAAGDPDLAWVCRGAGRMIRSPTVFEDVIKTICTTNCSWAGTRRMVEALVAHLGDRAPGAPAQGWRGRSFPLPEAMAAANARFYRDVVRAGYRGPYLRAVARAVADGRLDLEALGRGGPSALSDEDVGERLAVLPGVGPYAAAHIMMLLGRYSRLSLDSWTRPAYAQRRGRRRAADRTIHREFRRYGRYRGLAFWLYIHAPLPARHGAAGADDTA